MTPRPQSAAIAGSDSPLGGVLLSLAFWTSLTVSAGLLAVIVWAPRIVTCQELQTRYTRNAHHLAELEREIASLERLAYALEHEPDFSRRLAARELELTPQGAIPLSPGDDPAPIKPLASSSTSSLGAAGNRPQAWPVDLLRSLSSNSPLRTRTITLAAGLCLFAFLVLHEGFFTGGIGEALANLGTWCWRRYRRPTGRDLINPPHQQWAAVGNAGRAFTAIGPRGIRDVKKPAERPLRSLSSLPAQQPAECARRGSSTT